MAIDMYAIFLSFLYYQVKIFVGIIKKAVLFPAQSNKAWSGEGRKKTSELLGTRYKIYLNKFRYKNSIWNYKNID